MVGNRDERFNRPTAGPAMIAEDPAVFAPRDLEAGGTWFGVNARGITAALTNIRPQIKPSREPNRSRGLLVLDALKCTSLDAASAVVRDAAKADRYSPFNLLLGSDRGVVVFTCDQDFHECRPASGVARINNDPYCGLESNGARLLAPYSSRRDPGEQATWLAAIRGYLSEHPEPCRHGDGFGTRSSHILAIGADGPESASLWWADGPPCQTEFVDISYSLSQAIGRSRRRV